MLRQRAGEKKVLLSIAVRFHTEELLLNQRWVYHLFEICLMYMTLGFRLKFIGKKNKKQNCRSDISISSKSQAFDVDKQKHHFPFL